MTINITAAICIVILLGCFIYGYKVGFLRCIVRLVSSVLIFGLSGFAAKYIGKFIIENTEIPDLIYKKITHGAPAMEIIAKSLSLEIIYGVAFLTVVIIMSVLLFVTKIIVRIIERIPILSGINRVLGIVPAAAIYFLVIWAVFYISDLIKTTTWGTWLTDQIQGSEYLVFIYEHNLLKEFLMMIRGI